MDIKQLKLYLFGAADFFKIHSAFTFVTASLYLRQNNPGLHSVSFINFAPVIFPAVCLLDPLCFNKGPPC